MSSEHLPTNTRSVIADIIRDVCELPDYNSPEDQPELLQCTVRELTVILEQRLAPEPSDGAIYEAGSRPMPQELADHIADAGKMVLARECDRYAAHLTSRNAMLDAADLFARCAIALRQPDEPAEEPRPVAWIGLPEGTPHLYDAIYDNTRRLPGYRYLPIWRPEDHPINRQSETKPAGRTDCYGAELGPISESDGAIYSAPNGGADK